MKIKHNWGSFNLEEMDIISRFRERRKRNTCSVGENNEVIYSNNNHNRNNNHNHNHNNNHNNNQRHCPHHDESSQQVNRSFHHSYGRQDDITNNDSDWLIVVGGGGLYRRNALWEDNLMGDVLKVRFIVMAQNLKKSGLV